jgi:hypothetical protein
MGIPSFVRFPFQDAPGSELSPLLTVEQFNPQLRLSIPCRDVLAVNKVIGYFPAGEFGKDLEIEKMVRIGGHANAL